MPEVVAKQLFEYDRRMYSPGDRLTVEERFVRLLVALGRIEPPAAPAAARDGAGDPYRTAAIESPPEKKAEPKRRNRESLVGGRRP